MILYIASFFICCFICANLFFRSGLPLWLKASGTLIVFIIGLKYEVYQFLGGAFFSPQLPRTFLIIMEALYGSLIILFFLLLLWDLYLAGNWILSRAGFPVPQRLPRGYIKLGLCVLACAIGSFGVWQAVKVPDVRQVELRIGNLPEALDGFSIVQLSDLHVGPLLNRAWLEAVVVRANALEPDIIALTGDYVDGSVEELLPELQPLANLKARYGVFGVTGNHEYYWNAAQWIGALKDLNIDMLENEHRTVSIGGKNLIIAGLPDLVAERFGGATADIEQALKDAPQGIRLLLAHQPKMFDRYAPHVDAQLAGHTHGGIMFYLQPLIARFNSGFVAGLYERGEKSLYVNSGTGLWNGFSCRIGVPAEITRLVLRPVTRQ